MISRQNRIVISRSVLKLLANRPRDLSDVADILFVQGQLDEAYMRLWADPLGIIDRLETALEGGNE